MNQHWKEIIPVDRYIVRSNTILQGFDRTILTLLYQPLLGSRCLSLYMTLWSELEQNNLRSDESTHHSLIGLMQCSLKDIYQERLKLEGIGLLKTYVNHSGDSKLLLYELQAPVTPEQFFTDGVLNIYLYNRVGKNKFHSLKKFFSIQEIDLTGFTSITRSFNEVFQSVHPTELVSNLRDETAADLKLDYGMVYLDKASANLSFTDDIFNFDLFYAGLSENMVPKKAITPKVKETIAKLAFLYGIGPLEMQKIVISSLNESDMINIEKLRKEARDWYTIEHGDSLPSLSERVQPIQYRTMENKKPLSKEEELIQQLEKLSPKQLLMDLAGGAAPSVSDLQIIENIIFQQKLQPGVVNVLIYYVMLKTDMKLSKAYVEKIASHWGRKNIKTVKDAMNLAINEHREYQAWAETKKGKPKQQKIVRKELLPDWLQNSLPKDKEKKDEIDYSELKKELEKELKKD